MNTMQRISGALWGLAGLLCFGLCQPGQFTLCGRGAGRHKVQNPVQLLELLSLPSGSIIRVDQSLSELGADDSWVGRVVLEWIVILMPPIGSFLKPIRHRAELWW